MPSGHYIIPNACSMPIALAAVATLAIMSRLPAFFKPAPLGLADLRGLGLVDDDRVDFLPILSAKTHDIAFAAPAAISRVLPVVLRLAAAPLVVAVVRILVTPIALRYLG